MKSKVSQLTIAVSVSLLLHTALFVMLAWGWDRKELVQPVKKPNFVQAKLVQLETQSKSTAKEVKKDQPNKVDLTKKRQAEELRKKQEAERKKQAAIAKAKKEKAEKEKADKLKREKEKQEAERKAKALAEAERKRAEEQRIKREQEQLNKALLEEERRLQEEAYAVEAQSYEAAIARRVEQNWSRPPSARNGMSCVLKITMVPTGRVVSVNVVQSSGNSHFDRSAEQAVKKAEQFPEVKQMRPEVFERHYREFQFRFTPTDLLR